MKRLWLGALLSVCVAGSAFASETAAPESAADKNLRILLFSHHGPLPAALLEKHVPDARAKLLALAGDPQANAVLRERAVIALGGYKGDDVRALFDRLLVDPALRPVARVHVLNAYVRAFPERARAVLDRVRSSEDPAMRTAVAGLTRTLAAPERKR